DTSSDTTINKVRGNIIHDSPSLDSLEGGLVRPIDCGIRPASKFCEKSAASEVAIRIMNSGQIAYVEPQSCCDINAPLMAAIRMKGNTRRIPARRLIVRTDTTNAVIKSSGQRSINRSARSEASLSRSK